MNIYNEEKVTDQSIYDAYNNMLFNEDRNVFFKMVTRIDIFNKIKDLNGDIVECGVFKGSGLMLWIKLLELYSPHDIRKVIGFDFFDKNFVNDLHDTIDKKMMEEVFTRCKTLQSEDISEQGIKKKLIDNNVSKGRFDLVKGDVCVTCEEYIKDKPGLRISLLYLDMDLEEPTYKALINFWPRIVKGGVIVFDEYGYHVWSESNAVDKFVLENNLILYKTNVKSPTAYIIKN